MFLCSNPISFIQRLQICRIGDESVFLHFNIIKASSIAHHDEWKTEVVLSTLLEAFEFSSTKEIFWNMGGIQTPVLMGSGNNAPQLPLKVSLVRK